MSTVSERRADQTPARHAADMSQRHSDFIILSFGGAAALAAWQSPPIQVNPFSLITNIL